MVYVINVNHEYALISPNTPPIAPAGLRGLAINSDGNRLYVAAPTDDEDVPQPDGHILVFGTRRALWGFRRPCDRSRRISFRGHGRLQRRHYFHRLPGLR